MAIPEAVRQQAEALAAYDARMVAATEAPPEPTEPPAQDPPPPEPVTATEAATPPSEPRKQVKRQPDKDDEDTWKQRYYGLQGVFNVTVPPLQSRVKELEAKLEEMARQPQTPTPTKGNGARVTQQDVDAFGQDLIDMVDRKAQDVTERLADTYEARIKQLEEALARANGTLDSVTQTQVANEQERFFKTLGDAVPNWEEVQESAECQQWLASRIPGMKATWDEALKKAAAAMDGAAAVEVFQAFVQAHPQFDTSTKTKVQTQQSRELQRQVAPDKTSAAPVRSQSGKRVYTAMEFQTESDKLIRLAKQGNHVEAARIETELNAAMSEGRIRP